MRSINDYNINEKKCMTITTIKDEEKCEYNKTFHCLNKNKKI
jgi:hypothetical protein